MSIKGMRIDSLEANLVPVEGSELERAKMARVQEWINQGWSEDAAIAIVSSEMTAISPNPDLAKLGQMTLTEILSKGKH